jgi:deazaflavin-dependent oxidoreductase (nitroreductase family)
MTDFNAQIISEFRANQGQVTTGGFGSTLVLLHTVGARSGLERVNPVFSLRSGQDWIIIASKAGAPEHPDWYWNLRKNPDVAIETGTEVAEVTATELTRAEREDAWSRVVAVAPGFADYQVSAGERVIPVLRLRRRTAG